MMSVKHKKDNHKVWLSVGHLLTKIRLNGDVQLAIKTYETGRLEMLEVNKNVF